MKYDQKLELQVESFSDVFREIIKNADGLYKLCSGMVWNEGPAYINDGLYFSDVKSNKMYYYSLKKGVSLYRAHSNFSNGNYIDGQGRLVTCEHGRRCISRTECNSSVHILVDKYEGRRLNSPNDLVVKSDQTIWFTDPPYGIISDTEGYKAESQIIGCYVYRFDETKNEIKPVITDTQRPNGLAFSPDESILYVADMSYVEFPTYGRRHIRAYDIINGEPQNGRNLVLIEPGIPDGFRVDSKGRLYVSFEHGIKVLDIDGTCLGNIFIPERVSNCCFGGNKLFITASTSLYCIEINIQ